MSEFEVQPGPRHERFGEPSAQAMATSEAHGRVEGAAGGVVIAEFTRRPAEGAQRDHARRGVARCSRPFGDQCRVRAMARRVGEHGVPCRRGLSFQIVRGRERSQRYRAAVIVADVLWWCEDLQSSEHCVLERSDEGWIFTGAATLAIADRPGHIAWRLRADREWLTRAVGIRVVSEGRDRAMTIVADGAGAWRADGDAVAAVEGCVDVDLGWTPATNTLPIRRLDLAVGDEVTIPVAFLRFPELTMARSDQIYTRLAPDRWRYRSGPYDFELATDAATGVVMRYGERLWRAVASSA
jgi:uncharacterized protein